MYWLFIISIFIEMSNDFHSKQIITQGKLYVIENLLISRNLSSFIVMAKVTENIVDQQYILIFINNALGIYFFNNNSFFCIINISILFISILFIKKEKINLIFRSLFTYCGFILTTKAMEHMTMFEIAGSYYSIPIFSAFMNLIIDKKIKSLYIFEVFLLSYIFLFKKLSLLMMSGCFCFSICDILIKFSKNDDFTEVYWISFAMVTYNILYFNSDSFLHIIRQWNFIFIILGNLAIQLIIYKVFKNIDLYKLLPLRYISLIMANIADKNYFHWINGVILSLIIFRVYLNHHNKF